MKVQIVYLNPEDDIHSTRDMLSWVKAPRALLVWPDRGRVLSDRLDLVLLKRFSQQRKIGIGLLTFDFEIRSQASELGIPVFESMDDLPEASWVSGNQVMIDFPLENGSPKVSSTPQSSGESSVGWFEGWSKKKKTISISILTILILLLILLFLPSARISFSPNLLRETMDFEIYLKLDNSGGINTGQIPMQTVIMRSTGGITEKTSGLSHVPISKAVGNVTFTNLSQEQIQIPINTIVRTSAEGGIRFATTKPASLPNTLGLEVEVPIKALTLGRSGNVPMNAISHIEGSLGLLLNVTNLAPTSGGSDEIRGMVTREDQEQIEQRLIEELMDEAVTELKNSISPDRILVEGSIELWKVIQSQYDHYEADVADTISLDMTLEFMALTLSKDDLQTVAIQSLSGDLPPGYRLVPETMIFEFARVPSLGMDEEPRIQIGVQLGSYKVFNMGSIKRLIRGRQPSTAVGLVRDNLHLVSPPTLKIEPDWFPILPLLNERIELSWDWE